MGYSADAHKLAAACDKVRAMPDLRPEKNDKGEVVKTFCNFGVYRVFQEMGVGQMLYNTVDKRPMLAAEMHRYFVNNATRFERLEDNKAKECADSGMLVVASTMGAPGVKDEHVAVVYPGKPLVRSGKWNADVVQVSNVGKDNEIMGANYAFGKYRPEYFVLRPF